MLEQLEAAWTARWPDTTPIGHYIRDEQRDRWVRFHTLPGSKRYADSEEEYRTILARHHALLSELGLRDRCFVTWATYGQHAPASPAELLLRTSHWRTVPPDDFHVGEATVSAGEAAFPSEVLDAVLRAVADDQLVGVMIVPPDAEWLYHPYDGGADVIAESPEARDDLRDKFHSWLSAHPSGL